jgi:hypothetical protein
VKMHILPLSFVWLWNFISYIEGDKQISRPIKWRNAMENVRM